MIDDSETCAPAVQWSAIRFFIICSIHPGWMTRSVDWVNAFPQAPPDKLTFTSTPRGFMNKCGKDGCLKAVQLLCGSKFAPRTWCLHLRKVLLKLGFRECSFDKCLFHRPGMLIVLCADDAGIAAPNKESIDDLVKELRDEGFDLEMEGDFTECLGMGIKHRDDGSVCMTQKGLIEKIIATAKMQGCKPNKTPAPQVASGSDAEGVPWDQNHWDCASLVCVLLHVSNNTRPDIAFAVSQVA